MCVFVGENERGKRGKRELTLGWREEEVWSAKIEVEKYD